MAFVLILSYFTRSYDAVRIIDFKSFAKEFETVVICICFILFTGYVHFCCAE